MKNFKIKLSVLVLTLMLAGPVFSQTSFGVKAGLNLSNMLAKDSDGTNSNNFKSKVGFHVGPTIEIPFSDIMSLESGLLLSTKGYKSSFGGETFNANLMYVDIPLTAKATFDVGSIKIYGLLGPYVGVGLSGKFKGAEKSEKVKFGSGEDDNLKRLDYGLTVGTGIEINELQLGLSYNSGLANISSYTEDGTKIKNRVFAISVGYKFGK